ncbi:MAG TPA: amidase family protein [Steroidobacter sp.]
MKSTNDSGSTGMGLTRRDVLKSTLLATAPLAAGVSPLAAGRAGIVTDDVADLGAKEAVRRIQAGDMKAEFYASRLLQRHAALKYLNAMITVDEARVLEEARAVDVARSKGRKLGHLAGLPFIVKDQMNIAGYPTTAGNPALRHYVPRETASVADKLIRAGAVMLGKANCMDMVGGAFILTAVTSSNRHFGFVRNPYDTNRIPGGSSGGNGAAIAARIAPVGIGEDTGGSVRLPSAFNGIAGLRPSTFTLSNAMNGTARKRYPDDGMVPPAGLLDTWGPMARTVEDVAFIDSVISGEVPVDIDLRALRLGVPPKSYWESETVEPGVAKVMLEAFEKIRDAGATLVEVDFEGLLALNKNNVLGTAIRRAQPSMDMRTWLKQNYPGVTMEDIRRDRASYPECFADVTFFEPTAAVAPEEAKRMFAEAARAHSDLFQRSNISALAFPTVPIVAPLINVNGDTPGQKILVNGRWVDELTIILTNSVIGARLGAPALSLPAGLAGGLPVGLELEGLPGDDARILGIGMAIEKILGPLPPPSLTLSAA